MSDSEQTKLDNQNEDAVSVEEISLLTTPATPFLSDFSDGNSSSDIDDGDDEGIFATSPAKKKSSGSLAWMLSTVAVVVVGGYLVMKNPETVQLIKDNVMGKVAEESVPPVDVAISEIAPALDVPVEGTMTAPAPLVEQPIDMAATVPVEPSTNTSAPLLGDAAVLPVNAAQEAAPIIELPAANNQQIVLDAPKLEAAKSTEIVLAPMDKDSIAVSPTSNVENETKVNSVESVAGVAFVDLTPKTSLSSPPATQGTQKDVVVSQIAPEKSPVKEVSKAMSVEDAGRASIDAAMNDPKREHEEEAPVVEKKTVYFDSPDGKMMKEIPAPSMNPKKGKGESIIIVTNPFDSAGNKKGTKSQQKEAMTVTSTDLEPQILAASRAMKLERYDAAQDMYNDLYRQNQRDGRILMGRAILLQKTGHVSEAISAYEELLNIYPDNAEAVVNFAGLIRKEHPAMALNKLLDLKEKYPDNTAVLAQLGITYADSGNFEDAFSNLSHAAQLDPNNPQHYYNLGVISERAHDTVKAIAFYEKALEIDAVHGTGRTISRDKIYDRLAVLRGR